MTTVEKASNFSAGVIVALVLMAIGVAIGNAVIFAISHGWFASAAHLFR